MNHVETAVETNLPAAPLTLEGASVLHQMFRVKWNVWKQQSEGKQKEIAAEASAALGAMAQSAPFAMLGHKGDLMLVHFRDSFDELSDVELRLACLGLADYLEPATSYLSVVELGLYESTVRLHASLSDGGIAPGSPEWERATEEVLAQQRKAMKPRLWPGIPPRRYLCFYPMDKKRGEIKNWYEVGIRDRQRMMHEHGLIGRKYAGQVKQIITGSIGFDDWEWGVDLFADDPLVFKRLIYEMRFDEASALYALFGTFYVGLRFEAADLGTFLGGKTPAFQAPPEQGG
ncbi:MAG: hydrogen peroxide-dependent heme synthase [Bryobacteraceae bacterium]